MRTKANIYHHTHWDNEWYFTEEDSHIQLTYHMKELLRALEENVIDYFYLDGQTAILEDYLEIHKEDEKRVCHLIQQKKLFVGPFHTQIDSFITSGESIINNLRYGMNYANSVGGTSNVAYLPDSFGQTQDYPKIFKQLGIDSFVFRRGMGDEHHLPLDFIYRSNDGSCVVTTTLNCGYGFATEPFINQRLTKDAGLDYDGKDIKSQLQKLAKLSTLDHEFLLPIGNDQTPVIWNFKELLQYYKDDETYEFIESTLTEYMTKLKNHASSLPTYEGEFINPQYHRVHRSIYSARMDIKILQDKIERMMALEIQPIMTILHDLKLPYDTKLINRIWNLLGRSQTHSGATNTDETNERILMRSEKAYSLAEALKIYLIRKVAISLDAKQLLIVFFNTLLICRDLVLELEVYSKLADFSILFQGKPASYTLQTQEKVYGGVVRKDTSAYDETLYFYKTTISIEVKSIPAFSYHTLYIDEETCHNRVFAKQSDKIENEHYQITYTADEGLQLYRKEDKQFIPHFVYLEESGDEGDNYDYSYPLEDMQIINTLQNATCTFTQSDEVSTLTLEGYMNCPKDLTARKHHLKNQQDAYTIHITLYKHDPVIKVKGSYQNHSDNHRVRLVVKTSFTTQYSTAGTQFGYCKRENEPAIMKDWKAQGWLEEPSPIYPLLNYVVLENDKNSVSVFTKSSKEYEIIGKHFGDIAVTLFRSVGYLGLPDLNRRPGRASGIAEKVIPSPLSQMLKENTFEIGILYTKDKDMNHMVNTYNTFAVEACYYQNQKFNKVVYPITYFQTNPLETTIKDNYTVSNQVALPFAFSTLEMLDNKKVLRMFHNEEGCNLQDSIVKYDMFGNEIEISNCIRSGEIINLVLDDER